MLKASSCNCSNKKGHNWSCTDLEIQGLVIRSIDAFLDCISSETARNPLVKVCNDKWRRCMLVSLYEVYVKQKHRTLFHRVWEYLAWSIDHNRYCDMVRSLHFDYLKSFCSEELNSVYMCVCLCTFSWLGFGVLDLNFYIIDSLSNLYSCLIFYKGWVHQKMTNTTQIELILFLPTCSVNIFVFRWILCA